MSRRLVGLCGCVVLAVGGVSLVRSVTVPAAPTYSVATVLSGLHRYPGAWAGRTVLVRGWVGWAATFCPLTMAACTTQWVEVRASRQWNSPQSARLQISVPPGVSMLTLDRSFGRMPGLVRAVVAHLPRVIARPLARLFGGDGTQVLRVRLSSAACPPSAALQACVDGILVPR